jgi:uncharacterized protein (TIGR01777 family)
MLTAKGYAVTILTRNPLKVQHAKSYYWNIEKQEIDYNCLNEADIIINLSGSNIAEKPWTAKRKAELISSRVNAARLLYNTLQSHRHHVKCYIGASAIGFYPEGENLTEDNSGCDSFLSELCKKWERESLRMADLNIRTSVVRIGLVMSPAGGIMKEILKLLRLYIAPVFGNRRQWQSWIHIDDLCGIIIHLLDNDSLNGTYNAVAPLPLRALDLLSSIQLSLRKPGIRIFIPSWLLKIILGSRCEMLLSSQKAKADKIIQAGYNFRFTNPGTFS